MKLPACALLLATALAAAPAAAQRPVQPYEPAPRYRTFHLGAQLTGKTDEGRDIVLSWGRLYTAGPGGAWMPRAELSAAFATGVQRGDNLLEAVMLGPQLSLARAFPSQHLSTGRKSRAEPYLLATAGAYGVADFSGAGEEVGVSPVVSGGVGFRVFSDEWEVDLSTVELVLAKRFGFRETGPELYVRFGSAVAPRRRRDPADAGPLADPPPPPPPSGP